MPVTPGNSSKTQQHLREHPINVVFHNFLTRQFPGTRVKSFSMTMQSDRLTEYLSSNFSDIFHIMII